jgi:hypothetical protein
MPISSLYYLDVYDRHSRKPRQVRLQNKCGHISGKLHQCKYNLTMKIFNGKDNMLFSGGLHSTNHLPRVLGYFVPPNLVLPALLVDGTTVEKELPAVVNGHHFGILEPLGIRALLFCSCRRYKTYFSSSLTHE